MATEPRCITGIGMDLVRARSVVSSLAPLQQLSVDDAELVAKAIARCFAKGREQGWHQAMAALETPALLATTAATAPDPRTSRSG